MTCWAGFSAPETSAPLARSLIRPTNVAHHRQRDVGLEQRDADLAGGGVDVGVGQPPFATQVLQDRVSRSERVSNTGCTLQRVVGVGAGLRADHGLQG